jgi:hypothetical protein
VALTNEQTNRVAEILRVKLTEACPLCLTKRWTFDGNLVMLQTLPRRTFLRPRPTLLTGRLNPQSPPTYPTLPVMCDNCGNTVLLNVYKLGIADLWSGQIPSVPRSE